MEERRGEYQMKQNVILTIASLLAILFLTFHLTDDIVRGFEPGGFKHISGLVTLVVWLYGTLVLAGRRSGYVITLLGSLLASLMPLAHMGGRDLSAAGSPTPAGPSSSSGRSSRSA
jgi:hypothetical protein